MNDCKRRSETGRCFHIETAGAVDGPGLRYVLFLQGCPLRCPYCHNPEGWALEGGEEITVDQVLARMRRYAAYYRGGGLTVSGGEPLVQAGFVVRILERCREGGIHTALDTSACVTGGAAEDACRMADLLLLDIKSADPEKHRQMFSFSLDRALNALRLREEQTAPVWVRHVVVPGLTDSVADIEKLAALLSPFSCVRRVELLPFRKLCLEKYRALGIPFPLEDKPQINAKETQALVHRLGALLPGVEVI